MATRLLLGYSLLILLVAAAAFAIWWAIRTRAHTVRRRHRHAGRARRKAALAHDQAMDERAGKTD